MNQPIRTPDTQDVEAIQAAANQPPMPEVHRGTDGQTYAVIDGRSLRIDSQEFRRIARFELLAVGDQVPGPDQVRAYLDRLLARAHRQPPEQAYLRVFQREARILVDLANSAGEVVEIDVTGYRVIQQSEVRFLRPGGMEAMVTPVFGGDYQQLRRFIRLPEPAFRLLVAHLTYQFCDGAPQPIMVLAGEQGRSKSTVAKMVQMLTDPREPAVRQLPPSSRDLMVAARHSRVLSFDNVSLIKQPLSDTLCSLSTGGGYGIRTGHTDTEETRFDARRPIVLGGIGNFVVRDDLRDRCVFYDLEPIAEEDRVAEGPLWKDFKAALPAILGGLFDLCSRALGAVGTIKPAKLYRMADFHLWALAVQQVAGWPEGSIEAAYGDQRAASDVEAMEADLVVAIATLLRTQRHWSGTASALLEALNAVAGAAAGGLPRSAAKLGGELQRVAPLLRRNNIGVENQRTGSSRKIILTAEGPSPLSLPSHASPGSSESLAVDAYDALAETRPFSGPPAVRDDGGDDGDGGGEPLVDANAANAAQTMMMTNDGDDTTLSEPGSEEALPDADSSNETENEVETHAANDDEHDDSQDIPGADESLEAEVANVSPPALRPIYRILKGKELSVAEVLSELQQREGAPRSPQRVRRILADGAQQRVLRRIGRGNYTC